MTPNIIKINLSKILKTQDFSINKINISNDFILKISQILKKSSYYTTLHYNVNRYVQIQILEAQKTQSEKFKLQLLELKKHYLLQLSIQKSELQKQKKITLPSIKTVLNKINKKSQTKTKLQISTPISTPISTQFLNNPFNIMPFKIVPVRYVQTHIPYKYVQTHIPN